MARSVLDVDGAPGSPSELGARGSQPHTGGHASDRVDEVLSYLLLALLGATGLVIAWLLLVP